MKCRLKCLKDFDCMKLTKENEKEFIKLADKYYSQFGDKIEFNICPKGLETHMLEDKSPLDIFLYGYWYVFIPDNTSYCPNDFRIDEFNDAEFKEEYKILNN